MLASYRRAVSREVEFLQQDSLGRVQSSRFLLNLWVVARSYLKTVLYWLLLVPCAEPIELVFSALIVRL